MVVRSRYMVFGCAAILFAALGGNEAEAQARYASKERSHSAVAHYARARAMCVETLEEFEAGRRFARPDLMLDAEEWRLTLISLCEQLNRLVDPKVRISTQGVQVASNPRMVRRQRDRLPVVEDGPKARNDIGEQERLKEKQEARARLYSPQEQEEEVREAVQEAVDDAVEDYAEEVMEEPAEQQAGLQQQAVPEQGPDALMQEDEPAPASEEELLEQALEEATAMAERDAAGRAAPDQSEAPIEDEFIPPQEDAAEIPPVDAVPEIDQEAAAERTGSAVEQEALSEDEQIAIAIEQAIKEKLGEIDEEEGQEPTNNEEGFE